MSVVGTVRRVAHALTHPGSLWVRFAPATASVHRAITHGLREDRAPSRHVAAATLRYQGRSYPLDVLEGSEGGCSLDVGDLREKAGLSLVDGRSAGAPPATSRIDHVDRSSGVHSLRGWPAADLLGQRRFLDVAHLLLRETLPTEEQLRAFERSLAEVPNPHEAVRVWIGALPRRAEPIAVVASAMSCLSVYDETEPTGDSYLRSLAQCKAVIGHWYRRFTGAPLLLADPTAPWVHDLERTLRGTRGPDDDTVTHREALDLLLTASALDAPGVAIDVVRNVARTGGSLGVALAAAFSAFATTSASRCSDVLAMLAAHRAAGGNVERLLDGVRRGETELAGFGKRRDSDPWVHALRGATYAVAMKLTRPSPLLSLASELEQIVLDERELRERSLAPGRHYFLAMLGAATGLEREVLVPLLALGRVPTWTAHFSEVASRREVQRPSTFERVYIGPSVRSA